MFLQTGIQRKSQALLTISKYASEGAEGILKCDFHFGNSKVHVVWYSDRNSNISVCNYPGYCQFPNHQRYEAFINNRYSSFVISSASYYEDDGRWYCSVNGLESSVNFMITSIPKDFRFTNPPTSGVFIPDDGVVLNATAVCLYPKPNNVTMLYRIKGDQHYNIFKIREPVIEFKGGHSVHCLSHQSVMLVSNSLFNADFNFVMDTGVLFQFSYKLQSGKEKTTDDVVDLQFSSTSMKGTSTSTINAQTEISTHSVSSGNPQDNSSILLEDWLIPTVLSLILLIAVAIVYIVLQIRKRLSSCRPNPYENFQNTESEMPEQLSNSRTQEIITASTSKNASKTEESAMKAQTPEEMKLQEKNTYEEKVIQQESVDTPIENYDEESFRQGKHHHEHYDPSSDLQSSTNENSNEESDQQVSDNKSQSNENNENRTEQKYDFRAKLFRDLYGIKLFKSDKCVAYTGRRHSF